MSERVWLINLEKTHPHSNKKYNKNKPISNYQKANNLIISDHNHNHSTQMKIKTNKLLNTPHQNKHNKINNTLNKDKRVKILNQNNK